MWRHLSAVLQSAAVGWVVLVFVPAIVAPEAKAQATSAREASGELQEVVIIARRREEAEQKVPVAVSAFTGAALEELVINRDEDLAKLAPGLQVVSGSGNKNAETFWIRGQGQPAGGGQGPGVIPYFAEVPNFGLSYLDLKDLEVIEGPQGTLFGETATGGVVLANPTKPGNDFSAFAEVEYGDYYYNKFEAAVGGPIIPDRLMVRVAGQIRQRDGYTQTFISRQNTPEYLDKVDHKEWRVSAIWRPIDSLELYTIYVGKVDKSNGNNQSIYGVIDKSAPARLAPSAIPVEAAGFQLYTGSPPPAGMTWLQLLRAALARQQAVGPDVNFATYSRENETRFTGFINQLRWDITRNITFRNIFGIRWTDTRGATIDSSGTDLPVLDSTPASVAPGGDPFTHSKKSWSEEGQVLGTLHPFHHELQWQAGIYYRLNPLGPWTGPNVNAIIFGIPNGDPAPAAFCPTVRLTAPCSQLQRTTDWNLAPYAQVTFSLLDNLKLTGGYRRTWVHQSSEATGAVFNFVTVNGFNISNRLVGEQPAPGASIVQLSEIPRYNVGTYTTALDWQVNDNLLLYATHRTGFKVGGINAIAPVNDPNRTFGPEHVKDVEVGVKGNANIAGVRVSGAVDAYRDWYTDIQQTTLVPGLAATVTANIAGAIIQGIDVRGAVEPSKYFSLSGYVTIMDPYFTKWREVSSCGAKAYLSVCAGLPGTTSLVIDHAHGTWTTGAGRVATFHPDQIQLASRVRFGIVPTLHLGFFGERFEDMSVSANVYHISEYPQSSATYSSEVPSSLAFTPTFTIADLSFEWGNVLGSKFDLTATVTNLTDKRVPTNTADTTAIDDIVYAIYNDPRMYFAAVRYRF